MNITIITKEHKMTEFMQCCDVFEKWKVILGPSGTIEIDTKENNKTVIDKFIRGKDSNVIAVFDECGYGWFDDGIKAVSDGYRWTNFKDMLIKLGYKGIMI